METIFQGPVFLREKIRVLSYNSRFRSIQKFFLHFLHSIKTIGFEGSMEEYERRKLGVFNLLNFFQLLSGILIPVYGLMIQSDFTRGIWMIMCLPPLTSAIVLVLNHLQKYQASLLTYFLLYPFLTCVVYINGINAGTALHFILFGVLSVFFIKDLGYMLFMIGLSMVSYFILAVVLKDNIYELSAANNFLYLLNHAVAIVFIYYGLYLVKKENNSYQYKILRKNRILHVQNIEIREQKELITEKANQLEISRAELAALNALKNRLFSVVSHDLKSPLYALRNVFQNISHYDIPPEEVKNMIPELYKDLNYTLCLMENLLEWSKNQMQSDSVRPEEINVAELVSSVVKLLRLQAEAKQVYIESRIEEPVFVYADKDMINLVLRNLISNAIKFTPHNGKIEVGINDLSSFAEIYVQDSGVGISREALKKINECSFFTTRGTASESGTGLGLILVRDFLTRNGGQMHIESEPGIGSVFSFTLPACN
jgi:two-component system, sensor histidine kinase and response regulator